MSFEGRNIVSFHLLTLSNVYKGIIDVGNNGANASELVRENVLSHIAQKIIAIFSSTFSAR